MALNSKVDAFGDLAYYVSDDTTLENKINEIADDEGRGSHGGTNVNGNYCQHWRSGSWRIFGNFNGGSGKLELYGVGSHTGKGNSKYKVRWHDGKEYRASTA